MIRVWAAPVFLAALLAGDVAVTHHVGLVEVLMLFLVVGAPLSAPRLSRRPRAWVQLTRTGLVDHISSAQHCEVPWSMVHDVVPAPDAREVQLIVHDPEGRLERLPQVERLDGSPNRVDQMQTPWCRVHIPTGPLGTDPTTLAARIAGYWHSLR